MSRFSSVILAAVLYGCAAPAQVAGPVIPLSPAPSSAFAGDPGSLAAPAELWEQPFDPAELLGESIDFPAVRLLPSEDPPPAASQADAAQTVLGILREFVAPGKWNANALTVQDGRLTTRQPPGVLAELQSALKTLKDNRGRMIRSRIRWYSLPLDALGAFENIPPAGGGLVGTFDRSALAEGLLREDPQGTAGALMTITTLHAQKSSLLIVNQKAYVSGYDQGQGTYDPKMAVASEGLAAELRSIANGTRRDEFLLSFEIQVATPTELVNVPLRSGLVQLPAQGYARLAGRCTLRSDQALLLVARNPDVRQTERPILAMMITLEWAD